MKKFIYKAWFKLIATIVCVMSLIGFLIGLMGLLLEITLPNQRKAQEIGYENIAMNYSAELLRHTVITGGEEYDMLSHTNLKYAIIHSETHSLEDVDLKDESVCLYSNMKNPYDYDYIIGTGKSSYICYDTSSWMGALNNDVTYDPETFLDFNGIVYFTELKRFYYDTEEGYFPVAHFKVSTNDGEVQYWSLYEISEGKEVYIDENGCVMKEEDMQNWEPFLLCEENRINYRIIKDSVPVEKLHEKCYGYVEGGMYHYHEPYEYWVVSKVDEELTQDDFFSMYNRVLNWLYSVKRYAILILGVSFVLLLVSGGFLVRTVGHKGEDETIHLHLWDKIPFLIFTGIFWMMGVFLLELFLFLIAFMNKNNYVLCIVCALGTLLLSVFLFVAYCASVIVRIKAKKFWRYTLLYYITRPLKKLYLEIRENVPLFVKGIFVLGILTFLQIIVLVGTQNRLDILMSLFIIYKIVEITTVTIALLQMSRLKRGGEIVANGDLSQPIDTGRMYWEFRKHGENINRVSEGISLAVEERMKSERFKTELITNVSHDIKTPLTSIINYVDLIKKEEVTDPTLVEYIEILDRQSARLKKLIEDLMEASKASTGNLPIEMHKLDIKVLLTQVIGEYEERTKGLGLDVVIQNPQEEVCILGDSRHMWRVLDNLLNNICKYTLENTRVYIDCIIEQQEVTILFKNIANYPLNISSDDLLERFVRADESRNTEGSGLGLSIAQSLTELMGGTLKLEIDGDLFKAILCFPLSE